MNQNTEKNKKPTLLSRSYIFNKKVLIYSRIALMSNADYSSQALQTASF